MDAMFYYALEKVSKKWACYETYFPEGRRLL